MRELASEILGHVDFGKVYSDVILSLLDDNLEPIRKGCRWCTEANDNELSVLEKQAHDIDRAINFVIYQLLISFIS